MSLHIEVVGKGPALVLIHGWALHGGVFAPLVDRLAAHYQLHLVDLPGHGFSHDDATPLRLPHVVNAIAAATFAFSGLVSWPVAGTMALGATAGGYGGSRLAQRVSQARIRQAIIVIGLASSLWLVTRV